jgi:hypothetical protein
MCSNITQLQPVATAATDNSSHQLTEQESPNVTAVLNP